MLKKTLAAIAVFAMFGATSGSVMARVVVVPVMVAPRVVAPAPAPRVVAPAPVVRSTPAPAVSQKATNTNVKTTPVTSSSTMSHTNAAILGAVIATNNNANASSEKDVNEKKK